ncbi:MAG TPA: hypothetical protein VFX30_04235 [bacterium]|nr:hypothetical protein [bacterium]
MSTRRFSRIGLVVALVYAALAVAASGYDLLRAPSGGWLDLRGIETCLATLPACWLVDAVLPKIGLPRPDFYHRLESPYTVVAVAFSVLSCAAALYFLTAWIESRIRKRKSKRGKSQ